MIDVKVDACELHSAHFADGVGKHGWPAADTAAEDQLQRLALPRVSPLVEEQAHRGFRFPFPDVALEHAERHHAETVEAHIAVVALADVPREDAFAKVARRRLGKRAGTG